MIEEKSLEEAIQECFDFYEVLESNPISTDINATSQVFAEYTSTRINKAATYVDCTESINLESILSLDNLNYVQNEIFLFVSNDSEISQKDIDFLETNYPLSDIKYVRSGKNDTPIVVLSEIASLLQSCRNNDEITIRIIGKKKKYQLLYDSLQKSLKLNDVKLEFFES